MEQRNKSEEKDEGTPVCIKCFRPVDPLAHYCPNCGGSNGSIYALSAVREYSVAGECMGTGMAPDMVSRYFHFWTNIPTNYDSMERAHYADRLIVQVQSRDRKRTESR